MLASTASCSLLRYNRRGTTHLSGGRGVIKILPLFQAHVKQKNDVMAAMYCLEIAHRLKVHNLDEV